MKQIFILIKVSPEFHAFSSTIPYIACKQELRDLYFIAYLIIPCCGSMPAQALHILFFIFVLQHKKCLVISCNFWKIYWYFSEIQIEKKEMKKQGASNAFQFWAYLPKNFKKNGCGEIWIVSYSLIKYYSKEKNRDKE